MMMMMMMMMMVMKKEKNKETNSFIDHLFAYSDFKLFITK